MQSRESCIEPNAIRLSSLIFRAVANTVEPLGARLGVGRPGSFLVGNADVLASPGKFASGRTGFAPLSQQSTDFALVRRVSESSSQQIENLVGELQSLRKKLHSDGNRIQSEIEEYAVLNQQVMQLTAIISESMGKLPANGGGLRSAIARP